MAAINGGNVRVGLEDSLYAGKGKLARSNAEQVGIIRSVLDALSLDVATPQEARQILDLKGADRVGFYARDGSFARKLGRQKGLPAATVYARRVAEAIMDLTTIRVPAADGRGHCVAYLCMPRVGQGPG